MKVKLDEYVTRETYELLKKVGFDEEVHKIQISRGNFVNLPHVYQAARFLREKLYIIIDIISSGYAISKASHRVQYVFYSPGQWHIQDLLNDDNTPMYFNTYEDALRNAIYYALIGKCFIRAHNFVLAPMCYKDLGLNND